MCRDCTWRDVYIDELLAILDRVKGVVAEVPEAWSQLEHAGINFLAPIPAHVSS